MKKQSGINPFGLLIQEDLKQALVNVSKENKRSLNAEIEARLQASLNADKTMRGAASGDPVAMILAAIETSNTSNRVLAQALFKLGIENGSIQIIDTPAQNDTTTINKELIEMINDIPESKQKALLDLLKSEKSD